MRLQSTSFQFGGTILSTDDANFEARLLRIVDLLMLFLIQANSLLMELRVLIGLQTTIAQRTIDIMDSVTEAIEDILEWCMLCYIGFERLFMRPRWGMG